MWPIQIRDVTQLTGTKFRSPRFYGLLLVGRYWQLWPTTLLILFVEYKHSAVLKKPKSWPYLYSRLSTTAAFWPITLLFSVYQLLSDRTTVVPCSVGTVGRL